MNVTELARILKITPQELKDILPEMGFDIGQRAIKIDNRTAQTIIKEWPRYKKKLEAEKRFQKPEEEDELPEEKKVISIPNLIAVKDLAAIAQIPVSKILGELMRNGIFASINEKIDYETAAVIGADLGLDVQLQEEDTETADDQKKSIEDFINEEDSEKLKTRPPVIVVMGHVDHGKTALLDAIRRANVVEGEAGGITQHIGAYQTERRKRLITFIDTPGHEAFTAMRSRGAKIADIAILVVAADDGVKPQTIEAFRIIESAKLPFVVAINKIDKSEADINKTKQELSTQLNITPEDWGGKNICVPISAKAGTGVEDLLDMILLTADLEEEKLKANPNREAVGTIIESNVSKEAGPIATILIQNGTLKTNDQLVFDGKIYGKVRALKDFKGANIDQALPSSPVRILGLKIVPEVGDILQVGEGERLKTKKTKPSKTKINTIKQNEEEDSKNKKLNLIIKSDVLGSAEAIEESLEKISTEDVSVKIIHKGLGNITEGDIQKAEGSHAQILGFNVKVPPQTENIVREKEIVVKTFNIIYDLIAYVKEEMQKLLEIEIRKVELGKLKVLAIFRTEKNNQIIGGKMLEGKAQINCRAEIFRDKNYITEGQISKLQSGKQDVEEVGENEECGMKFDGNPLIEEGDIIYFYKEERIIKKL